MSQLLYNMAFSLKESSANLGEIINEAAANDSFDGLHIIVPTGKLVRKLLNDSIRKYYDIRQKPLPNPKIFTFRSFVKYCFDKLPQNLDYRTVSDAYRLALFEEASESANPEFFTRKGKKLSDNVLQRLSSVIFGLKEDGISPEALENDLEEAAESPNKNIDIPKLSDIVRLYREYEKICEGKYLDSADILNITYEKFNEIYELNSQRELFPGAVSGENSIEKLFPKNSRIIFHGFSEFKIPERNFISIFSKTDIPTAIYIDYSAENGPLFSNLENSIILPASRDFQLYDIAGAETSADDPETGLLPQDYLRRWLFNTEKEIKNTYFSPYIKVLEAGSRIEEVSSLVKMVKYIISTSEIAPPDICIAMRRPEIYTGLFREIFAQHGIPFNVSDRFELAGSGVTTAIFGILNLITGGFRHSDLQKVILNSYPDFNKEADDEQKIDAPNLIHVAQKLRIRGGNKRSGRFEWENRLKASVNYLKAKIREMEESYAEPDELRNMQNSLKNTEKALEDFQYICSLLPWKNKKYTSKEFTGIVKDGIIRQFGIKEKILLNYDMISESPDSFTDAEKLKVLEKVEADAKALGAIIKILDEKEYIMEDRFPGKKFSLTTLADKFRTAVLGTKFQIREKQQYGVEITSIEQTRGIPYKVMILCGAVDGEFPMAYNPESFLGKELENSEDNHKRSERMLFYQFLTNSIDSIGFENRHFYISYPVNNETEEYVRSPFVDALLKITTLMEDDCIYRLKELNGNAENDSFHPSLWLNTVSSKNEIIKLNAARFKTDQNPAENNAANEFTDYVDSGLLKYLEDYIGSELNGQPDKVINEENIDNNIREFLDKIKLKSYSVTELETYARCPFQYFIKYVLRVAEKEDFSLALSPLEKGSVMHLILFRFFTSLQKEMNNGKGKKNVISEIRLDPKKFAEYYERLLEIAGYEFEQVRFDHPFFELEENDIFGNEHKTGALQLWLEEELKRFGADWDFSPCLFEIGFNDRAARKYKSEFPSIILSDKLKVTGKIDRIEFLLNEGSPEFLIADYKSSIARVANNQKVIDGDSFQVPLYLAAAERIFKDYYKLNAEPAGGIYYALKPQYNLKADEYESCKFILLNNESGLSRFVKTKKNQTCSNADELHEIIQSSISLAEDIVDNISSGTFPVAPKNPAQSCRYCSFSAICRINENTLPEDEE